MIRAHRGIWAVYLLCVAACIYFTVRAARTASDDQRGARAAPPSSTAAALGLPTARDTERIVDRVFDHTRARVAPPAIAGDSDRLIVTPALASDLELRLIATHVVASDASASCATVTDAQGYAVRVVRPGDQLARDAIVVAVAHGELLIARGKTLQHLLLARDERRLARAKPRPRRRASARARSSLPAHVRRGVRQVGPRRWEIRRRALDLVLAKTHVFARGVRVMPAVQRGRAVGMKLVHVSSTSLFALLGLRGGDTLRAVNGHSVATAEDALQAYLKLRRAQHIVVSLTRGGATRSHTYQVR